MSTRNRERWRQAIDRWTRGRVRRQNGPALIDRRRVYILPTRFGWGFALMTFIMLLGATNYSNSMAFALSFLLASLGLVSLHHTHANLVNLRVRAGTCQPVFAGETLRFELIIDNPSQRTRYDLEASWLAAAGSGRDDLPAGGALSLSLPIAAERRGHVAAPAFRLSTEFPLGLFRAWTWIELEMDAWTYPRAIDTGAAPVAQGQGSGSLEHRADGDDDFIGLRPYREGDPLGRVHWKRMAMSQSPEVKQFGQTSTPQRWLDWRALPHLDREARLSQMSFWALQAQSENAAFGLRLPDREIAIGLGHDHLHRCLLALAMFQ